MLRHLTGISFAVLLSLLVAIFGASVAHAAPKFKEEPGGHLVISEVFVDFATEDILITVENFDIANSDDLVVTLGDLGDLGDIGVPCDLIPDPKFIIQCDFDSVGLPADGDYLLTVATSGGQSEVATYDLTIGAVGPEGPEGPQGPEGPPGVLDFAWSASSALLDTISPVTVSTACPQGEVIFGHYSFSSTEFSATPSVTFAGSFTVAQTTTTVSGWRVTAAAPVAGIHTLKVWALCAVKPPSSPG